MLRQFSAMSSRRHRLRDGNRASAKLGEIELIQRYFTRRPRATAGVQLGIGDDAAVLRIPRGRDLVVATDTLQEGTHFNRGTPAHALGHRCLAVNLSDLAAMGAEPRWATLVLSLPAAEAEWLSRFARGFFSLARRFGVELVGGDTVRGPLALTVTVLGHVRPGVFVRRSGARPGDSIYVTGHPGDAVAGRLLLADGGQSSGSRGLARSFLYPTPRMAQGRQLVRLATAMIDISDGLDEDLGKLLRASGCGAELEVSLLPLSRSALRLSGPSGAIIGALTGGDDYELLFTVPPGRERRLLQVAASWDCSLTRIGCVSRRPGRRWTLDRRPFEVPDTAFRHF